MTGSTVLYEQQNEIATVTLNRPDAANALNPEMLDQLLAALARADATEGVRAVVLTGAGERNFCSGADLTSFREAIAIPHGHPHNRFVQLFLRCRHFTKPLIGAINGNALAGGFGLALSCDLLVASDTAAFGTPEVRVGIWPMMITSLVVEHLGPKRTLELFMTGQRVNAETALQWGIVNEVLPADVVKERALQIAQDVAQWSPDALRRGRAAVYETVNRNLEARLASLENELSILASGPSFQEGAAAFLEKRPPRFGPTERIP